MRAHVAHQIVTTRRRFLKATTFGATAALLAACGGSTPTAPAATPVPTSAPKAPTTLPTPISGAATATPTGAAQASPATPTGAAEKPSPAGGTTGLAYTRQRNVYGGQPIKLTMWDWYPLQIEFQKGWLSKYTDMHPNVTFEITTVPLADYAKKLQAAIPAKQAPDMFQFWLPLHSLFVENGLLRELPPDRFPPAALERSFLSAKVTWYQGKAYWIPLSIQSGGIWYNKKMWRNAGLTEKDAPKTWDDLVRIARELTVRDSSGRVEVAGFDPVAFIPSTHWFHYYQQGYWYYNREYTKFHFNTPQMRKVLQWFSDLYNVHQVCSPDFLPYAEAFGTERAAMVFWWAWGTGLMKSNYPQVEFGVFPCPTWTGQSEPAVGTGGLPASVVVPVSTPEHRADICFDVLQYFYSNTDYLVENSLLLSTPPTSFAAQNDPRVQNDPTVKALLPQLSYVIITIGTPAALSQVISKYVEDAPFKVKMPIDQALAEGQAEADRVMQSGKWNINEREYSHANLMKFHGE